jgi:hypothetical protein
MFAQFEVIGLALNEVWPLATSSKVKARGFAPLHITYSTASSDNLTRDLPC